MKTYPLIVTTLWEFGLITEEEGNKALDEFYDQEEIIGWWYALADIAYKNSVSAWSRFWSLHEFRWKRNWINERAVAP